MSAVGVSDVQEPTFLVLCALASGPKHGYGIRQDVAEVSAGEITMRTGTLYAALDRLLAEGLIDRSGSEVVDGRTRYYYALTDGGRTVLAAAAERRLTQARIARARLKLSRTGGAVATT